MNILITGNTGFLGRHLSKRLESLGHKLFFSNTKIANLLEYKNLHIYNGVQLDCIFHLAAHTKAGDYCLYHQADQFEINQLLNTNILKYWNEFHPSAKLVAIGTSCSYSPQVALSEDNYLSGDPDEGLFTYAMTKRMLLVGLKAYQQQFNRKYSYIIPSTLYGPDFDLGDSHFIFDLIKKIYAGKEYGIPVELWGDGFQKRELVFIDDAVSVIEKCLERDLILNLGSGQSYSIREFAQIICNKIGFDSSKISYNVNKYVGVRNKQLIIDKLKSTIPDVNFTSVECGIEKTIDYYINKKNK